MTPEEFCRWLRGFAELSEAESISPKQWQTITKHLSLVYTQVTEDDDRNPGSILESLRPICGPVAEENKAWQFNPAALTTRRC